jgi:hypothetical protein
MADSDEKLILDFLGARPGEFFSAGEIARKAGGRHRYQEDPHWAYPLLQGLITQKRIETNAAGHYRVAPPHEGRDKL